MTTPSVLKIPAAVWGKQQGWVSVPVLHRDAWHEKWLEWPNDGDLIAKWIEKANEEASVYWSPLVFPEPSRRSADKALSRWAWADLDHANPTSLDPEPTVLWESSPGRYQALFRLSQAVDKDTLEGINRRLCYRLQADPSGWDAGQVLRVPATVNHKYDDKPRGRIVKVNRLTHSIEQLEQLPEPVHYRNGSLEVNEANVQQVLEEYRLVIPMEAWYLLETDPRDVEKGKRSTALWSLIRALTDAGLPAVAVYTLAKNSVWNKFRGRSDEDERLREEVRKAFSMREKSQAPAKPATFARREESGAASQVKRIITSGWLSRYIQFSEHYASDVPKSFHTACGLALLSCAVGQLLKLAPTYPIRNLHPNMYVLLIAPTRGGKSRAMDVARQVVERMGLTRLETFSPEGLIMELAESPMNQVWWDAEEITGAIKQTQRRGGYMSNVPELLITLFDRSQSGLSYRRRLAKGPVELPRVHLTLLGATTPENYLDTLTSEAMHSGFLPRFWHFYDPDPPIPTYDHAPAPVGEEELDRLAQELMDIRDYLMQAPTQSVVLEAKGQRHIVRSPQTVEAYMPTSAWQMWREWQMGNDRKARQHPELAGVLRELGPYALKAAMLMAVSRRPELMLGGLGITEEEMETAIRLAQQQLDESHPLYDQLGAGRRGKIEGRIVRYLKKHRSATRTELLRSLGSALESLQDFDAVIRLLEQKEMVVESTESGYTGRPRRRYVWVGDEQAS